MLSFGSAALAFWADRPLAGCQSRAHSSLGLAGLRSLFSMSHHLLLPSVSAQWWWLRNIFVGIFSPSIWEKYSFKTGICPPVPRWLFCAQACTSRHHCLCMTRPALLLIQVTTLIVPNNGACPIAHTEAHGCCWKAVLPCPVWFPIIIPGNSNPAYT